MESKVKCPRCRCWREKKEYLKNNKILKTCNKCRENSKKSNEPKEKPNEPKNDPTSYIRHQKIYRKLNIEFMDRAARPVHVYNFKAVLSEIKTNKEY